LCRREVCRKPSRQEDAVVARLANSSSALLVVVAALSPRLAVAQHAEAEHAWSYEGASGPAKWGDLKSEYTVVAVVFKLGQANPFIEALWKNLPPDVGREHAPEGARMDLNQLLPASHGY
jgi:carbonic anhydrase